MSRPSSVASVSGCLALVAMAALFSAAGAAVGVRIGVQWAERHAEGRPRVVVPRGKLADWEETTIAIFERAAPSVVFITRLRVRWDPFRGNLLETHEGTGSGIVWDKRGHIVTNFHVIQGASGARVTLADQSVWRARLVGSYADKDLAVLRIAAPPERLHPIALGTSRDLRVGQSVFAVGNPFGLDHTLSTGVVSGLDRTIQSVGGRPIYGAIQTDAAINPGNSGGPLLDSAGRMIGINTQIISPSGASAGVGFAIPVDTVRRVVEQLIRYGRVIRPVLGVRVDRGRLARRLGVQGAIVLDVVPGSGAAQAGMQPAHIDPQTGALVLGDVIVEVAGRPVRDGDELERVLDELEAGQQVDVVVLRDGQRRRLRVRLMGVAER